MIIVDIRGGLGNQMFQYALYRRLKEEGKTVRLGPSWIEWSGFPYIVDNTFNTIGDFASYRDTRKAGISSRSRFVRGIEHRLLRMPRDPNHIADKNVYVFDQAIEDRLQGGRHAHLDGFWQNEGWFSSVKSIIQKEFSFRNALDDRNAAVLEKISRGGGARSVAVHVRRYSSQGISGVDKGIDYYEKAIRYFSDRIEGATYYVFSYDIDWCRANIETPKSVFVHENPADQWGQGQWKDMMLMSHCQNIIISNSTYSWWGAYLNPCGVRKNVVSPSLWMEHCGNANPNLSEWVSM